MRSMKSVAAFAVATLAAAGLAVTMAPAANAATGSVFLNPATGNVTTTKPTFTAPACSAGSTSSIAFLSGGPDNWAADTFNWKGPGDAGANNTIAGFAATNSLTVKTGTGYKITYYCQDSAGTLFDTFTGTFSVDMTANSGFGSYTMDDTRPSVSLTTPTASGTVTTGTATTLSTTASVTGATGSGKVQFFDGATAIGAPVTVASLASPFTANLSWTFTTSGAHPISAVFTADATATAIKPTATSSTASITSNGPNANVNLALASSAASIDTTQNAVLTVTATNAGTPQFATAGTPTGSVQFTRGGAPFGAPVALDATGKATLTVSGGSLGTTGSPYTFGASLTAGTGFNNATSNTVTLVVTPSAGLSLGDQTIQTNVVAGTITLTGGYTAASGAITLGFPNISDGGVNKYALQLNSANNAFSNIGAARTDGHNQTYRILVTDTRAGNLGYKVTGQVQNDFTTTTGDTISSSTLGWAPFVSATCTTGQVPSAPTFGPGTGPVGSGYETVVTSPGVACTSSGVTATPGSAVVPGAPNTTQGLKSVQTLFTTTAGASNGTVSATANLDINAPTTTKAGYYTTKLVLTAI